MREDRAALQRACGLRAGGQTAAMNASTRKGFFSPKLSSFLFSNHPEKKTDASDSGCQNRSHFMKSTQNFYSAANTYQRAAGDLILDVVTLDDPQPFPHTCCLRAKTKRKMKIKQNLF